uniref:C2H2-type domain-containing protein n=1 Tax=Micrurus spixii TaxID=129469 RepID=A0A2D4MGP0_9SAUR
MDIVNILKTSIPKDLATFYQTWGANSPVMDRAGERPFQCRYCPYSASQKGNLKTHVQCVHRVPFDNSQYPDLRFPSPPNNYSINPLEGQLENIFTISPVPGATVL